MIYFRFGAVEWDIPSLLGAGMVEIVFLVTTNVVIFPILIVFQNI